MLVIEHLEPKLSEWLFIEYSNSARIAGEDLLITNVRRATDYRKLSQITRVERKSALELFQQDEIIVLDPLARKPFSPEDLESRSLVLIGGILGNDPPLGRTRELLSKKLSRALKRNIGRHQFAIDGAVHVAKQIISGKKLEEIPVQVGLEVPIEPGYSNILPYAFPLVGGKPLIAAELIDYLRRH
ncbi:MAG: SAM-dependent methyltransferase [Candidatus Hadarchaeum sp.]|uniref:SAM-dependent methyltransferase n=1 Tax=Candidatus Hadarchaeum sp. TaxID=2883567 RepID=UPI003171725A